MSLIVNVLSKRRGRGGGEEGKRAKVSSVLSLHLPFNYASLALGLGVHQEEGARSLLMHLRTSKNTKRGEEGSSLKRLRQSNEVMNHHQEMPTLDRKMVKVGVR